MKRLNLLPTQMRARTDAPPLSRLITRHRSTLRILASLVLFACAGYGAVKIWQRLDPGYIRKRIHQTESAQEALSDQVESRSAALTARQAILLDERKAIDDRLRALSQPQRAQLPISDVLMKLVEVVPQSIWVSQFKFSANRLTITGTTENAEHATTLIQALDQSGFFKDTTFVYTQLSEESKESSSHYTFQVTTEPVSPTTNRALQWKN